MNSLGSNGLILGLVLTFDVSPRLRVSNCFNRVITLFSSISLGGFLICLKTFSILQYIFSKIYFIVCCSVCI